MIQAVQRAFGLAREVAQAPEGLRLADLARRRGLNKVTAFHLAETLVAEGMLSKSTGALYRLGPLAAELTRGGGRTLALRRAAEKLAEFHRGHPHTGLVYAELGEADLFSRFSFAPGRSGQLELTDGSTLNPYLTVSGVLHFANLSEERLHALRLRHPFVEKGLEAWGSERAFRTCVAQAARRGWSETPSLLPSGSFKNALAVRDGNGMLVATITVTCERGKLGSPVALRQALQQVAAQLGKD